MCTINWLSWSVFGTGLIFIIISIITGYKRHRTKQRLTNPDVKNINSTDRRNDYGKDYTSDESLFQTIAYYKNFHIPREAIQIDTDSVLGIGQFGYVYSAKLLEFRKKVAVKLPKPEECTKDAILTIIKEVKLLCYIGNHDNLVKFLGYSYYLGENDTKSVLVVMELCDGGSLLTYLKKLKNPTKSTSYRRTQDLMLFSREICCGMKYIASQKVVHGDLAARNILLNSYNTCKIGDFGLSQKLYAYQTCKKKREEMLPWRWMAYESLRSIEFSTNSDVWSFGVTLWEIFSLGDMPFPGLAWSMDFVDQLEQGLRMSKPAYASQEMYQLMLQCWNTEPQDRSTFPELLNFFNDSVIYANIF